VQPTRSGIGTTSRGGSQVGENRSLMRRTRWRPRIRIIRAILVACGPTGGSVIPARSSPAPMKRGSRRAPRAPAVCPLSGWIQDAPRTVVGHGDVDCARGHRIGPVFPTMQPIHADRAISFRMAPTETPRMLAIAIERDRPQPICRQIEEQIRSPSARSSTGSCTAPRDRPQERQVPPPRHASGGAE
jgi:hypothetical protein